MALQVIWEGAGSDGGRGGPRLSVGTLAVTATRTALINIGDGQLADGSLVGGLNAAVTAFASATGINIGTSLAGVSNCVVTDIDAEPIGGRNDAGSGNRGGWTRIIVRYGPPPTVIVPTRPAAQTAYTEFVFQQGSYTAYLDIRAGDPPPTSGDLSKVIYNGQGVSVPAAELLARVHTYRSLSETINPLGLLAYANRTNTNNVTLPALKGAPSGNTFAYTAGQLRMTVPTITEESGLRKVTWEMVVAGGVDDHAVRWRPDKPTGSQGTTITSRVFGEVAFPTNWLV
jgi:hypothetical protein